MTPSEIIEFWRQAGKARWFAKDAVFDAECRHFEAAHHAAARGEFADWSKTADGALALVLLLDQIPRNLYRGSAHAFATDVLALRTALCALDRGFDAQIEMPMRIFIYLPLEHAESLSMQAGSVALFKAAGGDPEYLKYAELHQDIIVRFGRFPHRNACLGRESTEEETAFLSEGGFQG